MRSIFVTSFLLLFSKGVYSQGCCSGGSGSPIAGGASQGVLLDRQMEVAGNYQYNSTNKFFVKDHDTIPTIDRLSSNYTYLRVAYGVTKNFTMSVESGYYINKTLVGLNKRDTVTSSGIGDLILFPRYDIYNHSTEKRRTEITLGLGYKIPLGKHDDSTVVGTTYQGKKIYTTSPPTVQPTSGAQDIIFYAFLYRGYPEKNFRIFANGLYVKKGWNSLGEKFGDYASVGLFVGKTFFKKLGVTAQIKGEWIGKMQGDKNVDLVAFYNIYTESTGGRKIFFVPQISYSYKSFTAYVLSDIPLYQYLNGNQIGSQNQVTVGLSYRFMTYKNIFKNKGDAATYVCPMKCEGKEFVAPGKCPVCGMELIKQ
jgi:hypothetical protein